MARRLQYVCSAMLRQWFLQGLLEYHPSESSFWSYVFFCDFSSILEPCGLHFRGPGHPRAALGSILAPLVPKADSRGSVGRPFWRLWAPFGPQVGRQSASKRKAAFRSHILSINLDVILSDFSIFSLQCWYKKFVIFGSRFLGVCLVLGAIRTSEI